MLKGASLTSCTTLLISPTNARILYEASYPQFLKVVAKIEDNVSHLGFICCDYFEAEDVKKSIIYYFIGP